MKIVLIIIFLSGSVLAQCSDAGICSVGGHSVTEENGKFNFGLEYLIGGSGKPDSVTFHSVILSSEISLTGYTRIYASIPFSIQTGPLGDVSGIGDLLLLIKQRVYEFNDFSLDVQAGAKLATGSDNKSELPQIYQSGLGSNDLLAGFAVNYYNINFGAAYQLAGKRNSNILELERGDDLLLRGGYNYFFNEDISASVGVLSINRLQKSTIRSGDSIIEIDQSDNSQVNIEGQLIYKLRERIILSLSGAVPLRERPDNSDGLKRSFSLSAGINFQI